MRFLKSVTLPFKGPEERKSVRHTFTGIFSHFSVGPLKTERREDCFPSHILYLFELTRTAQRLVDSKVPSTRPPEVWQRTPRRGHVVCRGHWWPSLRVTREVTSTTGSYRLRWGLGHWLAGFWGAAAPFGM